MHLLAQFRQNILHDEDQQRGNSRPGAELFRSMRSYAQPIRHATVVKNDFEHLESPTELEAIFIAGWYGDVEACRIASNEIQRPG